MITPKADYSTEGFNPETVTIQDCLDNYYMKGLVTAVSSGGIRGFVKEVGVSAENRTKGRNIETTQWFNTRILAGTG